MVSVSSEKENHGVGEPALGEAFPRVGSSVPKSSILNNQSIFAAIALGGH
ncbi:hypothetical protein [Mastigocladopsis repens]|nr:hypothetical protein [Mastigocladopsis repens]